MNKEKNLENLKKNTEKLKNSLQIKLEEIGRLTEKEAKEELLKITEEKYEKDILG